MANNFNLILDTTAPGGAALTLNGGAGVTSLVDITARLATTDTPTTGYQIKIWGDVDLAFNASIQATEGASAWITPGAFPADTAVKLLAGDGVKNIHAKIRDDVWNETAQLDAAITLDTAVPIISIVSGPDATKISTVAGKRTVNFGWQSDSAYSAYEVEVVANAGSARGTGTVIGNANGSTNVSGGAGPATTTVNTSIDGRDIAAAAAGDGTKVVKVFVQDSNTGNWSA